MTNALGSPYLRALVEVLGFIVCQKFPETQQLTWEKVFCCAEKTLFSWDSRLLFTLQDRVSVVQTYSLSKLWYVAQVLPLTNRMAKKFEKLVSSFIFRGRHERLKLAELQNLPASGGLGLTCVSTKAEALLLRQSLRILARPTLNCSKHVGYWLGSYLQRSFPDLEQQGPVCQVAIHQYPLHAAMLEALEEGLTRLEFTPDKLLEVTTKKIYQGRAKDVLTAPKVELEFLAVDFKELVYPRLKSLVLEAGPRD